MYVYVFIYIYTPAPPNVPLLRALWSPLDGILGVLKGSWGVLVYIYIRIQQLLYLCLHVRLRVMYVCVHVYNMCMYADMHMFPYVCVYICVCTYKSVHIHT